MRFYGTKVVMATLLLVGLWCTPLASSALTCPDGTEPASKDPKNTICIPTKAQTGLSDVGVFEVLMKVANWLLGFIAALAIVMIIVGGMVYLISGGDEEKATAGKKIVTFAIIGLMIALLSWVMVKSISMLFGTG